MIRPLSGTRSKGGRLLAPQGRGACMGPPYAHVVWASLAGAADFESLLLCWTTKVEASMHGGSGTAGPSSHRSTLPKICPHSLESLGASGFVLPLIIRSEIEENWLTLVGRMDKTTCVFLRPVTQPTASSRVPQANGSKSVSKRGEFVPPLVWHYSNMFRILSPPTSCSLDF
jgi:hypothetical protein